MSLPIRAHAAKHPPLRQALAGALSLQRGRVHELCGPSRMALAALVMAKSQGPAIWIHPGWTAERLNPAGLQAFADPARLILVQPQREEEALWAMEEALRSGAAPLVVAELVTPPALTPVRRLHLAAETGSEVARRDGTLAPIGLLLLPQNGGAQGIESRWHMAAAPSQTVFSAARSAWTLTRLRARMEMPARWRLIRSGAGDESLETLPVDDHHTAT